MASATMRPLHAIKILVEAGSRPALLPYYLLSGVIAILTLVAAAGGLFIRGLYRENAYMLPQAQGNDLVTLLFALPLFVGSLAFAVRGSLRARVIWLGVLGYLTYTYTTYALDAVFNPFFLLYVSIFGLCVFTAIGGLLRADAEQIQRHFAGEKTARAVAIYCLALAVLVGAMWSSQLVPALLTHTVPASVALASTPTNFVWALDLGVLIPLLALAGVWLWRRRTYGYLLAGVVLVKGLTLGLAIVGMAAVMLANDQPVEPDVMVIASIFVAVSLPLLALYLPRINAEPKQPPTSVASGHQEGIPRWCFLLPAAMVPLLLVVTLAGLLVPGLYRDNAWIVPQNQTQDLYILIVAVPALVVALVGAARGSPRARLVLLGALAYFLYGYIHYSFSTQHNQLFLAYVWLMGLALYALIGQFAHLDSAAFAPRVSSRSARPAAVFLMLAGGLVFLAWLADIILALATGTVPETVRLAGTPTSVTYAVDLGVLVPACYVAAIWLWQGRPMGYALTATLLVTTTLIDLVGVPLSLVMGAPGPAAIMAVLAAIGLAVTVWFFNDSLECRHSTSESRAVGVWTRFEPR